MIVQPYNTLNHPNVNVTWMNDWSAWILYIISIFGCRYILDIITLNTIPSHLGWTFIHLMHALFTFILFHVLKGSAFHTESKEIQKLTLWEQIDGERAFTPTKKFLTIVPILLFLVTWHTNEYKLDLLNIINCIVLAVIIIAKLPIVHGVRFFGINSE